MLPISALFDVQPVAGEVQCGALAAGVTPDIFVAEDSDDFLINSETDNQLNYAIKLFNS